MVMALMVLELHIQPLEHLLPPLLPLISMVMVRLIWRLQIEAVTILLFLPTMVMALMVLELPIQPLDHILKLLISLISMVMVRLIWLPQILIVITLLFLIMFLHRFYIPPLQVMLELVSLILLQNCI